MRRELLAAGPRHGPPAPAARAPRRRRPGRRRADQHAPVGVRDQLDQPVVAGVVDPAAAGRGEVGVADPHLEPGVARLRPRSGRPTPISGSVNVTRGTRAVVGGGPVLAEDVADRDRGLVHRHVGEGAVAGDVADGPQPLAGPHPLVDLDGCASGSSPTVSRPRSRGWPAAGGDQELVGRSSPRSVVTWNRAVVVDPLDVDAGLAPGCPRRAKTSSAARWPRAPPRPGSGRRPPARSPRPRTGRRPAPAPRRSARRRSRPATRAGSATFTTSRLVQYGVPSSPSIGGAPATCRR